VVKKTYQSWNGIDETLQKEIGNSAGAFTDEQGNAQFYDNRPTITNKIILNCIGMKLSTNWNTNFALHYTKGKGFYENYKEKMDFLIMVLQPVGRRYNN
jgi:iron complex outermembrane receptor protein